MRLPLPALAPLALALAAAAPAIAADASAAQAPAPDDQVIVPQVERSTARPPKYPSNDFELSVFGGVWQTQSFGASGLFGARLGYDITEDFFVEASYGRTRVSDKTFRQILPGGVFTAAQERLSYYDLSLGWNFLPGEVFLGKDHAYASTLYLIGGLGSTTFDSQRN